ncbi:ADPRM diphosphatase, partial [Urocolius indicus]|nr:ADPRM diphosphatase [Urocolius indicus]
SFGVVADIQHADAEDGYDYEGCRRRYYRQSLRLLRDAVDAWAAEEPPLAFVLQLGDCIDGLNGGGGAAEAALERVLAVLGSLRVPLHHAWGNHELYNFSRARLQRGSLRGPSPGAAAAGRACHAYDFSPAARFRVVVLDAYDLSVLGREPGSPRYQESLRLLREKNPNDNLNNPEGLEEPRFVEFNGGFSQTQLDWFNEVLKSSDENQEKVVVMGRWIQGIYGDLGKKKKLCCSFAAPLDSHGVHHLTLAAIIETPPESNAFGTIYVYEDKMILKGRGRISDRVMHF